MKLITATLVMMITLAAQAQHAEPRTFTSPDHEFAFSVPASYALYNDGKGGCGQPSGNLPRPVSGYGWDGRYPLKMRALVCIAYPASAFPNTTFLGAALQFWDVTNLNTRADCESFAPPQGLAVNPNVPAQNSIHTEQINGINFVAGSFGAVATGTVFDMILYRTFHNGRCYEMATGVNFGDYPGDSGETKLFSRAQVKLVHEQLRQVLMTFRFLR